MAAGGHCRELGRAERRRDRGGRHLALRGGRRWLRVSSAANPSLKFADEDKVHSWRKQSLNFWFDSCGGAEAGGLT
ncbi:hypothetical protein SETIT_5G306300v2 [Setaria italica]|uniref:Uncharacterized protein n=1 Tax=Setaria italica TaxID=4555 RepID=A0A368RAG7_SETIT|nr:hypothetical protein SETIT_5G306300v2 [Setaria italica]